MKSAHDIIIRPVITEAAMDMLPAKKYVFEVALDANKVEIRKAIEEIFGVKVLSVNTIRVAGKNVRGRTGRSGRKPERKKAIIRLTEDSKTIELFEGMV